MSRVYSYTSCEEGGSELDSKRDEFFLACIRTADWLTDILVLIVALAILFAGAYGMYDGILLFRDASGESLKKVKSGYGEETWDGGELLDSNIAWLSIDGTNIDYPVMQGEDNNEFLNKDPYGKYSLSGSIFLDSRNNSDFSDGYSLIYGHHMAGGFMFGALDAFAEQSYLEKHKHGTLKTKDGQEFDITLFAFLYTDASDELLFNPGESEQEKVILHIKELVLLCLDDMDTNLPILAMSTCRYPDTTERTFVIGHLEVVNGV